MALTTGVFLTDSGAPAPEVGVDGDHYRNTDNDDIYFKAASIWALVGNMSSGADGVGTTILNDDGEPLNEVGSDGNYFIDNVARNLWHKVSGIWTLVGTLIGEPTPGSQFARGEGVPDNGLGEDGYYYFDMLGGNVYFKAGGVWTLDGSWLATPTPADSIFLSGPGAPAELLGADYNHYRDTDNQDIYHKEAGVWVLIGSWASGGGGSSGPFTVANWDMTGPVTAPTQGTTVLNGTNGGAAPAFTLTPDNTLSGAGPFYWSATESTAGIPITGTSTMWADFVKPVYTAGDNLFAIFTVIVNSGATLEDLVNTLGETAPPVNPVWGVSFVNGHSGPGAGIFSSRCFTNSIGGTGVATTVATTGGDNLGFGINFATMTAVMQENAGTVAAGCAVDFTGFPEGETLKVVHLLAFAANTPVMADAPLVYAPSSNVGARQGFGAPGQAVIPSGAADGDVFKVTVAGDFGGVTTKVGDFVQLYDNESKLIVTRVADVTAADLAADVAALEGADTALDGRLDTAEATLLDHGTRIGDLEAASGGWATRGKLLVEAIDIPEGHTVTPYELGFEGSCGGYRELTIRENGARIKLVDTVGIAPARTLISFKASSSLGDEDRVHFDYSSEAKIGALTIPCKSFLETVYEVIHDGMGSFKITAIPLGDRMHIRTLADGLWTDRATQDDSTPYQVLDITGKGTGGAVGAAIPHPWLFQSGEVIVSLIGGVGDSITDLVLSTPSISGSLSAITLNAGSPYVPGDCFSIRVRRTMIGGYPKWAYFATKLSPSM